MIIESRSRGQPLLALVLLVGGWIGMRAFYWEQALDAQDGAQQQAAAFAPGAANLAQAGQKPAQRTAAGPGLPVTATGRLDYAAQALPQPLAPVAMPLPPVPQAELLPAPLMPVLPARDPAPAPAGSSATGRIAGAAGHHAMWLAATALMPLPPLGIRQAPQRTVVPARRWSADGWLLLRPNPEEPITPGPLRGTYGASQAGAVVRYRLDRLSGHKPSLYARGAAAIGQQREHEAALGLSARPLAALPLVAMAEARVNEGRGARTQLRPAVAVVTELAPQPLPLGFTGELYVQGGWIGGRKPTGFIDGLARAERPVAVVGPDLTLKAGAGAWGAKQRGASRFDLGPVASLAVRLGDTGATARIEADWRFRVGGRSRPKSGPVLTVSAGF